MTTEEIQLCLVATILKIITTRTKATKIKVDGTIRTTKDSIIRIKATTATRINQDRIITKVAITKITRIIRTLETKINTIRPRIKTTFQAQEVLVIKTKTNLTKISNKWEEIQVASTTIKSNRISQLQMHKVKIIM